MFWSELILFTHQSWRNMGRGRISPLSWQTLHWVDWGSESYMRRTERIGTDGRSPPGRMAPTPLNAGSPWPSGPKGNEQHPVADSSSKWHGKEEACTLGTMSPTWCPSASCQNKVYHMHSCWMIRFTGMKGTLSWRFKSFNCWFFLAHHTQIQFVLKTMLSHAKSPQKIFSMIDARRSLSTHRSVYSCRNLLERMKLEQLVKLAPLAESKAYSCFGAVSCPVACNCWREHDRLDPVGTGEIYIFIEGS